MPEKDIFQRLAEATDAAGLDFLLIGGHAVNAHGYNRTTLDLDFLAREVQRQVWDNLLTGWGYRLFHERKSFSQYESPTKEEFDVDAMFVDDATFLKLKSARKFLPVGSFVLPVAGVLHLIALKLHATRTRERAIEGKDFYDIVNLIRINHIDTSSDDFLEILNDMPMTASKGDSSANLTAKRTEGGLFDLNLPHVGPGEGPLPLREPDPSSVLAHAYLLLKSTERRSFQERAATKNPEPFRI